MAGRGRRIVWHAYRGKDWRPVRVLCDENRKARYQQNDYVVNGVKKTERYVSPADAYPVDLVLIATKASGFADAMEQNQTVF